MEPENKCCIFSDEFNSVDFSRSGDTQQMRMLMLSSECCCLVAVVLSFVLLLLVILVSCGFLFPRNCFHYLVH